MKATLTERIWGARSTHAHAAWVCVLSALALSLLGIYSIDLATTARPTAAPESAAALAFIAPLARNQLVYLAVGLVAAVIVTLPHPHRVRMASWPALALVVAMLIFLLLPFIPSSIVRPRNGCRGWIDLGPFDLQPSEIGKIAFTLAAAAYLRYRKNHRTVLGLLPPALLTAVPVFLVMLQPDLGMALLFVPAIFAILLAAGARLKHLAIVVLCGALAAPASYPFLKPYQQERIIGLIKLAQGQRTAATDPELFQASTAITLAGSGAFTGYGSAKAKALIAATQLPERHNDMVFSIVVLRFGMLGGLLTLALYALWILAAALTAARSRDPFGRLMIVGFIAILGAQTLINVGMNLGVVPIVGLTLPFVSYGGSSMATFWIMTGLVVGVAMRRPPLLARPSFEFGDDLDQPPTRLMPTRMRLG